MGKELDLVLEGLRAPKLVRIELPPESALAYLQSLYRDPSVDPIIRRRAAIACLPFESPKLEALAIRHLEGDMGERLDRAIKRTEELNKAGAEAIEYSPGKVRRL
jgi:hypothetical protein